MVGFKEKWEDLHQGVLAPDHQPRVNGPPLTLAAGTFPAAHAVLDFLDRLRT